MNHSIDGSQLKKSFLGEELLDEEIEALKSILTTENVAKGEILINEEDDDQRLFLLADGKLEVLTPLAVSVDVTTACASRLFQGQNTHKR